MLQQTHTTPGTGLQSFADSSPDYELAPVGIASMRKQAQQLADFGRNGDIYVIHAAEGETVIPMGVLDENPKLKKLLFDQMEDLGLDPERYVVGNELNNINPDTGLPEFWGFIKKFWGGVKKVAKKVWKVVKKAAPIVLPIAAAAFGIPFLGPSFGAGTFGASFLGGGIGSLIGGASLKDSFKAGLIGGGMAVGSSVLSNAFKGNMSFADSLKGSFTGATPVYGPGGYDGGAGTQIGTQYAASPYSGELPFDLGQNPVSSAISGKDAALASGEASAAFTGNIFSDPKEAVTSDGSLFGGAAKVDSPGVILNQAGVDLQNQIVDDFIYNTPEIGTNLADDDYFYTAPPPSATNQPSLNFSPGQKGLTVAQQQAFDNTAQTAMDTAKSNASWTDFSLDNPVFGGPSVTSTNLTDINPALSNAPSKFMDATLKNVNPGLMSRLAVPAVVGAGALYAGGVFDAPEEKEVTKADLAGYVPQETGFDLFSEDPERYRVQDLNPYRYAPGNPAVPSPYAVADGGYMENPQYMNMGGTPQFPRREMLVEGPGTERSDDIPAMLSDGEFVMNSRAVRGADPTGRNNRYAGAQTLYNMMRNFEMKA